jgi:hypothetical protein
MTAITTRRATQADAEDVAAMVREVAADEDQAAHVHVDEAEWRRMLARPDVIVLLAERDDEAVGYVSAVPQLHLWTGGDVLNLDDLCVRPGHRDAGADASWPQSPSSPLPTGCSFVGGWSPTTSGHSASTAG